MFGRALFLKFRSVSMTQFQINASVSSSFVFSHFVSHNVSRKLSSNEFFTERMTDFKSSPDESQRALMISSYSRRRSTHWVSASCEISSTFGATVTAKIGWATVG
ncbi:uncharacterized protein PITG_20143 [Phytophthora infestans T30-4]|uniref:Uncharacterized protein n=1 Tax=Phytophthora infestans (strain T30-4) TaxID=403677 RepID=D0P185_PHYIT|nr:uncharacterized protein PITG_20143 [Phytophthora infestans T30-4]EEY54109.1 hypothetical protein PITG_20143 [Phytophthora infestans T30-4]|eukprot:XP_002895928.1 hypothetical protein PITG_20143 [Phytophthora infestans T30-4]